jgi:hypothetical protein
MTGAPAFFATGNITPSFFVAPDTAKPFHVKAITAAKTQEIVGIADQGTYQPPGVVGSDAFAAHDGQPIRLYQDGDVCLLKIDAGAGVTAGDLLGSTSTGTGITIAGTVSGSAIYFQGATALETANAGELCRVVVRIVPLAGVSA